MSVPLTLGSVVAKLGKLHHPKIDAMFHPRLKALPNSAKILRRRGNHIVPDYPN